MTGTAVRRFLNALFVVEAAIAGIGFCVLATALFLDVVGREAFGQGIFGAQRVAVYGMCVAAFLGFVICTHQHAHIAIGNAERLVPKRYDAVVARVADLVSAAICLFLAYWALRFVMVSYQNDERGVALGFVVWPLQLVIPWAFASAALRYFAYGLFPAIKPAPAEGV